MYTLLFLFWAALGLHCCSRAFSSCGEQRLLSSCSAGTTHFDGFSCGAQALGAQASVAAALSFSSCDLPALGRVGFSSCGSGAHLVWLMGPRAWAQ